MGRSRRRQRHGLGATPGGLNTSPAVRALVAQVDAVAVERLEPTYQTVVPSPEDWAAGPVAPVLALDCLEPWEEIRGPALALEEPSPIEDDWAIIVSQTADPCQLELTPVSEPERCEAASESDEAVAFTEAPVMEQAPAPGLFEAVGEALADAAQETHAPAAQEARAPAAPAAPEETVVAVAPEPQPDPIELLYSEARAAAEAGRVDEARARYRELLTEQPGHVRARNNLALLLDAAGDHAGALAELDRALDGDAENPTLLVNRGALLGAMGRFAAAERDLKRVLRVEPAQAEALFNLGVVMTKKGLWAEAVPHLRRAIELDPGRGAAYFYLGEALNHVDDLHGAMAAYQRARELQPNNPRALYGLGIVYDRLGRPDDAASMYRRSREVGRR